MSKHISIILSLFFLVSVSCKKVNQKKSDITPPSGASVVINSGALVTISSSVTLTLSAVDAYEMYVTNTVGCSGGGSWESYSNSKAWTLVQINATATMYAKFRDRALNVSECVSDSITHDDSAPSGGTISINGAATQTNSTSVTLTLSATDANEMYVTNTAGCGSGGTWQGYATSRAWTLGQINGTATVYVKYRDINLNETGCFNDSISHLSLGWTATSEVGAPTGRAAHTAIWTGSRMIVWGGHTAASEYLNSGASFDPVANEWTAISNVGAPSSRSWHTAVWTGSKMIVWGGIEIGLLNNGGIYDPSTDSWTNMSNLNAPNARIYHTAVWTGTKMVVYGYYNNPGGIYDLATDTWSNMSSVNEPEGRVHHTAVWTGSKMIIWGGYDGPNFCFVTGGLFDPILNLWSPTSIVNTPPSNTTNPQGRINHTATWTGTEMFIWGGETRNPDTVGNLNTGGLYNPETNSWRTTTTVGAPTGSILPCAVWTGSRVLVWGGAISIEGGLYDPTTDSWSSISTVNSPERRGNYSCIWTGNEMVVFGGWLSDNGAVYPNSGGIYRP